MLIVAIALAIIIYLFHSNRKELLTVIKDKEGVIDANVRAIAVLQADQDKYLDMARTSENNFVETAKRLEEERAKNGLVLSQRKSSETRLGQISENLAPFLEGFQHDPKDCRFLGSPIDIIAFNFNNESIHFIEVKTGGAKESKRQKIIKNAIKCGRVYYEQLRISEKGVISKQEKNNETSSQLKLEGPVNNTYELRGIQK